MSKWMLFAGALNMAICVGLGAFGAHALKGRLSERLFEAYQTGIQYHLLHALGLLAVGLLLLHLGSNAFFRWAGYLMLAGIVLFSGSLYSLALGAPKGVGVLTPFGGITFIAAWLVFSVGVWKSI